ncbi:hypothetical protein LEP1GSC172_2179 [Leptospira noguchii]|uniref:Uncharacterized protein n=2 Tax=Leptospira noguchii TaxID=28182 RepID=T0GTF7_9LEPT|nr:hypothetical protein LEP1GSC172_2179 [Leptospira noguchii]EQA72192.1 hypothetical protein LEP1GSC059_4255 [Leptospira noguchii serovar Panama str. CZ214]
MSIPIILRWLFLISIKLSAANFNRKTLFQYEILGIYYIALSNTFFKNLQFSFIRLSSKTGFGRMDNLFDVLRIFRF